MKSRAVVFAVLGGLLAACSLVLPAKTTSTNADQIRSADQQWLKVFAPKDVDKSVAFMTPNGSMLAPNAPIATGADAVRKLFAGFFALPDLHIKWTPAEAEVSRSGELGFTRGVYEMSFTGPGGAPIPDKGKYVTVWKKQSDGSWKVAADIFNSDLPPAGASAPK